MCPEGVGGWWSRESLVQGVGRAAWSVRAYLSELLDLLFPLCTILIFLDGAEDEVDLGDYDFGE